MPPARTPTALLHRARRGDRVAFTALFDEERDGLRRLVRRRLGGPGTSEAEVDDVVQQAAVQAYGGIERLRGDSRRAWRVWLRRIVTNVLQDHLRRLGRDGALRHALPAVRVARRQPDAGVLPLRRNGAEQALYTLRHLGFDERLVVSLQIYHDLTWETTHVLLRRPTCRAARSYYERVRDRLRAGLRHLGLG